MKNTVISTKITKTTFSLLIFSLFTFAVFSISSCLQTVEKEIPAASFKTKFPLNDTPLETLVKNPKDAEDEYICREHIKIAKVLVQLVRDKAFVTFALQTAKENEGTITYEQVFAKFPQYKPLFRGTAIAKRFNMGEQSISSSPDGYDFVHTNYGYNSVIFIPNYTNPILIDDPIVSPAIEIRDDIENDNHDIIFAWELVSDFETREIQVGERDADIATAPIFATSLDVVQELGNAVGIKKQSPPDEKGREVLLQTRAAEVGQIKSIRINVHYDRSAESEVFGAGDQYVKESSTNRTYTKGLADSNRSGRTNKYRIADIHINNTGAGIASGIGVEILKAKNIFTYPARASDHIVYYNTYERDWYAKSKDLGSFVFPNPEGLYVMEGRRVYFDEWLTFEPGPNMGSDSRGTLSNLRNVRLPVNNMRNGNDFYESFDGGKGEMGFKKTE